MDFIKKLFIDILIGIWLIIAIFVTACLLSYNTNRVTQFGSYTLLIMDSDELEPDYNEGDLLVVKKESNKKIGVGDKIFFYNRNSSSYLINLSEIKKAEKISDKVSSYEVDGLEIVTSDKVIGRTNATKVYANVGYVLNFCTSKWGYIVVVIFPTLFAIIFELFEIVNEVREEKKKKD